ncbi:Predicted Co/Zn/Cd cation transporter, cation efflux family [Lachnospiraceae bacterium C7]|nr:Predicted Co/Zn/Cd cation transporter, cation efflux family [Lachnospiraceae bacterium C7]
MSKPINNKEKVEKMVLRISFIGSAVLSVSEIVMAIILGSYTVLMDGIFDTAELAMMGPLLILVPLLYKPVSEKRPYGYAQVESLFLLIKYGILFTITVAMISTNIHIIYQGGHKVSASNIAGYEIFLGIGSIIMYVWLKFLSEKYASPTIKSEIYMWKTDIVGSIGISVTFLFQAIFGETYLKFLSSYIDSIVAITLSVFLLKEPVVVMLRGFKKLVLFAPPKETMDRIRSVVDKSLEEYPYEIAFLDVIQTGRKTWIEVYLQVKGDNKVINLEQWGEIRTNIKSKLKYDFDQLYVELIPDIPEK